MSGINRVGQKVRCIEPNFKYLWCPNISPLPKMNGIYTVGGFEDYANWPGIHLNEFTNTNCDCIGKRMSWPIKCFVPLVDDQVKNKHITEIVTKVTGKKIKEKV